ncbi:endonuclease [Streptomyces sp. NRRL_ISP-5395]|uniref:endonuclease n=1 Tax=Streptomyces TaxID=1883 RepID=UPI0018771F66|nr:MULTISPECIES: endonuclease [Streptomyces]MCX4713889.1 endonuclease [Streptomyces griseus]MDX2668110.1 endonuclease [Streptomyces sp. NRRL_ISP-5395]QXR00945.1 endonuclease [Streptomyces sp. WY228]GHF65443.1 endonuclease [Streptomyces griseus]
MSREVSASARRITDALLEGYGRTYAAEAGVRLRDTPQPLYQLLVLSDLLSARIRASVAVAAARALFAHGMRTPRRMADATWQQRVDALGEGGYRRYDERTSTQLGEGAELVLDVWKGDLRRLRAEADGDGEALRAGLRRVPGIGPAGADIFVREVQDLWPEFGPWFGAKGVRGAERLGLPASAGRLAGVARGRDRAAFAAALVRAALDPGIAGTVRETARARK